MSTLIHDMKTLTPNAKATRLNLKEVWIDRTSNVREDQSYDTLDELKAAIESVGGLLQPIGVVEIEDTVETEHKKFALVWGFRRALALMALGQEEERWLEDVPAMIVDTETLGGMKIVQLMENLQRRNLNPIETALGIEQALADPDSKLKAKDLAALLGLNEGQISQHRKLLKLPKEIQKSIGEGEISFSHARVICYTVPEDRWVEAAKAAKTTVFGEFQKAMENKYGGGAPKSADEDAAASTSTDGNQKAPSVLRATMLEKTFVPFLKQRVAAADKTNKTFTASDIEQARLDAIETVMKKNDTQLAKDIQPFIKKQEEQEEKAKQEKEFERAADKFFKERVKDVRGILDAEIDATNPNAKRPTLADAYAQTAKWAKETYGSLDEKALIEKVQFKLNTDEKDFVEELSKHWLEDVKAREESKAKREKAKKEKEEADKKAAAEAAKAQPAAAQPEAAKAETSSGEKAEASK